MSIEKVFLPILIVFISVLVTVIFAPIIWAILLASIIFFWGPKLLIEAITNKFLYRKKK